MRVPEFIPGLATLDVNASSRGPERQPGSAAVDGTFDFRLPHCADDRDRNVSLLISARSPRVKIEPNVSRKRDGHIST